MKRARSRRRWLPRALPLVALAVLGGWRLSWAAAHSGSGSVLSAARDDGGLHLAISVPRWPFFRDELVPVSLALTNNSGHSLTYYGFPTAPARCAEWALTARMTRGSQDLLPVSPDLDVSRGCRPPGARTLPAGASLRLQILLALPVAGRLTLSAQAQLDPTARVVSPGLPAPGGPLAGLRRLVPFLFRSSHVPFASGRPTLSLWVSDRIPPNRRLHLLLQGHTVQLPAREQYLPGLVEQQSSSSHIGGPRHGEGLCVTGGDGWQSLPPLGLFDRPCTVSLPAEYNDQRRVERWQVSVGAPGYAIADGTYCFDVASGQSSPCPDAG